MPPPKKAAKKTAKKAAKKGASHHGKHHEAKDLRRAYEHLGRLAVLRKFLESYPAEAVDTLAKLAQNEIRDCFNKSAADLLRASEHLGFAVLVDDSPDGGNVSTELVRSIKEQYDELLRRADDHWEGQEKHSSVLAVLYKSSRKSAAMAFKDGTYRRALEFARAVEALAHVRLDDQRKLGTGTKKFELDIYK